MFRFYSKLIQPHTEPQTRSLNHPEIVIMSRFQIRFLLKQTLTAICLNALFSGFAVIFVFRNARSVDQSGAPSLIADSIFQTFMATLMSVLPPSIMTARWMGVKELDNVKTPTTRILIRALLIALLACLASAAILPFAVTRLLVAPLSFRNLLLMKCLYGMAIGVAVTPFAASAVLRGSGSGRRTEGLR
jgi:hypothetical protein